MKKYEFIKELLKQLKKYKKKDNKISEITHGDLNFGNIIKEDNSNLRFIDPKIKVAKKSIYFNKEYDYAKILQSLEGYHHIIAKKKEDLYLKKIKNFYISELKNHSVKISNIYLLTSMLFITLIPFHSSELKDVFIKKSQKVFNRYLNLISN